MLRYALLIRSQGAGFYKSQHTPCELSYNTLPLLKHPLSNDKKMQLIYHLLPKEYHPKDEKDIYEKILKITDYVSGMTDSYATSLFQELSGISLGTS
nr:hypothetical protein [Nostoc sp. TCL26-01]